MKQPINYSTQLVNLLGDCVDETITFHNGTVLCIYQYERRIDVANPGETLHAAAADIRTEMQRHGYYRVNPVVRPTSSWLDVNCLMALGHKCPDCDQNRCVVNVGLPCVPCQQQQQQRDLIFINADIVGQIVQWVLGSKGRWSPLCSLWRQLNRLCCLTVTASVKRCNLVYLQREQHRYSRGVRE